MPYLHVDELLITGEEGVPSPAGEDLGDLEICVRGSSSFASTLAKLWVSQPELRVHFMPETLSVEGILDLVAAGECQSTVVDSHVWAAVSGYYESLRPVRTLAHDRAIALALRRDDLDLRRRVNEYLIARALTAEREEAYAEDLPGLRRRKRLRMITRNNSATYFIHRGAQRGFEYELLRRFAEAHDLRLEIVIPPSRADLEEWLLKGKGDVIAASLSITPERRQRVNFTRPFLTVQEVVVTREDESEVQGPEDLEGRTIHVRPSSSYRATLDELLGEFPDIMIEFVAEEIETEEILARVEDGTWDLTICDSNLLELERNAGRKIKPAFPVAEASLGWAVRPSDSKLLSALNDYIASEYRGLFYNVLRNRYFRTMGTIVNSQDEWRSDRSGRISPYDDIARRYAEQYELDWRLIVAQMYQESRFEPDRASWSGAKGLMQILPRTARELGVSDVNDPESSVHGGVKYMRWLIDRYDPKLPLATRIRFALASYNAGRGHVLDAQRLASRLGLDPDEWYGNVEEAMLLLQRPEFYEHTRYGYCRGSECVRYVREIDRRYRTYVAHVPG
jgi:membrane-bound lytic murein transglycosylase F